MKINEKLMKKFCAHIFPSISPQHIACNIAATQQTREQHKCLETLRTQNPLKRENGQKILSSHKNKISSSQSAIPLKKLFN